MIKITATIKDVAKYTGLSIATISKYINGGNVLDENKVIIQEAIKALNFRVNEMARGLKTNKSMTIGILIPYLESTFCTSIVSNIENVLMNYGYSTIICDYKGDCELQKQKLEFLVNKMVDGIVLMPLGDEGKFIQEVMDNGTPIVLIDRVLKDISCDVVLADNLNGSYDAVEQFIISGHRRIGIIVGPEEIYTAQERLKGYYRVHEDYSLPVFDELIKHGDYQIDSGYNLLNQFVNMEEPPSAVFITNYEMTLGAIMAINENNIVVPDQLSVIGFDNLEMARIVKPPLSIVIQPMKDIGETAANLLMRRINNDNNGFPARIRLKTDLLIKGSICKI